MGERILNDCIGIISDVHVGSPGNPRLEDFDRDESFEFLLRDVLPGEAAGRKLTLIINGDFIDFPQIRPELGKECPGERFGVTEEESVARVGDAIQGHPRVFGALRDFVGAGHQVLLMPGNHDIDLHFPGVLGAIRAALGNPGDPSFSFVAEGTIRERRIYVEHGNQYSYDNRFEHWSSPIVTDPEGKLRIERPWGTMFMDLVYNDIEELYPFVNKVYPHGALARIVARIVRDDPKVPLRALAQLVAFLASRGKRMIWEHLMGEEEPAAARVTQTDVEAAVDALGEGMDPARRAELIQQAAALVGATDAPAVGSDGEEQEREEEQQQIEGLLGRTDEKGLRDRANDLLRSGTEDVVVFGHTHDPVDRTETLGGRTCRELNTGGWIPRILVPKGATPSLEGLAKMERMHELRYAWIELGGASPTAALKQLG